MNGGVAERGLKKRGLCARVNLPEMRTLENAQAPKIPGASFRRGDFAPCEPEFGVEFWDICMIFCCPEIWGRILGSQFWVLFFSNKKTSKVHSAGIHRHKFTFTSKNQSRTRAEIFTLHFRGAISLINRGKMDPLSKECPRIARQGEAR